MDPINLIEKLKAQLDEQIAYYSEELNSISVGRATTSLVDNIKVEIYGQTMPLKGAASIVVADPQSLFITVWDSQNIQTIEKVIADNTDLAVSNLGDKLKLTVPLVTEEFRNNTIKRVSQKQEEAMIASRNIRQKIINQLKQDSRDKLITEDDMKKIEKEVTELLTKFKTDVEKITNTKITELRTI
jgi:ribosome recycling factor